MIAGISGYFRVFGYFLCCFTYNFTCSFCMFSIHGQLASKITPVPVSNSRTLPSRNTSLPNMELGCAVISSRRNLFQKLKRLFSGIFRVKGEYVKPKRQHTGTRIKRIKRRVVTLFSVYSIYLLDFKNP